MLKEGGSLGIDTIGNKPIDEDIDLLPDTGGGAGFSTFDLLFYSSSMFIVDDTVSGPSTTNFVEGKVKHFYCLNAA
tara:strand:- start:1463 stop:1690 length:228 start_codon:yes stop_codon:yes gene_type:complete